MKTSAGILSYEIYNQEGKNELSVSTQANYTQLLKLKLRNSSPYHQVLFEKTKTPHLILKFKKGVLPKGFKSNHIKIHKYRLIKGSDLFSQSALEGYLFDRAKMEKNENFQVDVQKILDSIDDSQATRSVISKSLPFGIDSLLTHFKKLTDEKKLNDEDKKTYKWISQLEAIQADYKTALSDIRRLTLSNDIIKANPLFTSIIQEAATVFEKLTKLQENSAQIERSLESLAQQVHAQQKADIQSLEANFQKNYKASTGHLIAALKTNLKTIIVDALHGTKIKDITNLKALTIDEDIVKTLERKVFTQAAIVNSDWTVNITQKDEEDSITFTCGKEIQLAPNEYLLMDFELVGALRGTAQSVATELNYSQLVFQKDGVEDTSVKDKLSQSILNLVNDGAFGIPPELELLVADGKNILNNGQYVNTIQLNIINKGLDNITLSEASKLRLSFYNQQENETVAYALQGKDDVIESIGFPPEIPEEVSNTDLFKLIKNQNSLTLTEQKALLAKVDKNELLKYTNLSTFSGVIHPEARDDFHKNPTYTDEAIRKIKNLLGIRMDSSLRFNKSIFAFCDNIQPYTGSSSWGNNTPTNQYTLTNAYIFELEYKEGESIFHYKISYSNHIFYDCNKDFSANEMPSDLKYLGRIQMSLLYDERHGGNDGRGFELKIAISEIVEFEKFPALAYSFEPRSVKLNSNLKTFLVENGDLMNIPFRFKEGKVNSIESKFEDFDDVFYNHYTIETKPNKNKTIQYTEIMAVKKVSSKLIEVYQPFSNSINNDVRDLETVEIIGAGFDIKDHLNKASIVPERMELIGIFYLGTTISTFMEFKGYDFVIPDDTILSALPTYETFLKKNQSIKISYLSKLGNSSTIQTTYENNDSLPETLTPNQSLELILRGVKTQLPNGAAILKISLLNIPNYKDAHLSATVNRVSYLTTNTKGFFTTGRKNNNLQIAQDAIEIKSDSFTITTNEYKIMPIGSIMMWYGEVDKIPGGWGICDGSLGTPDLRDKFVVGAGKTYKKGATGGKKEVSLSSNQMPSHNHEVTDGDYYLKNWKTGTKSSGVGTAEKMFFADSSYDYTSAKYTKSVGGGASHENRPPYYALYYIMRINRTDRITSAKFEMNSFLRSNNSRYTFVFQSDSMMIIYDGFPINPDGGHSKWDSRTNGNQLSYITMKGGDLIACDSSDTPKWSLSEYSKGRDNPYYINAKAQYICWNNNALVICDNNDKVVYTIWSAERR